MEGITNKNYAKQARDQQKPELMSKSTPSSISVSKKLGPLRSSTLGRLYLAPAYGKPRTTQPPTGLLPASKVTKQAPKLSAAVREKAKRSRLLAKMNDYSEPAPEIAEHIKVEKERMALEAAHPERENNPINQQPRFTYPTNL
ncbi:hypothetical protein DL95DRAFT_417227 [Leptodontidium sp. 2 PMI_412]|nr:hypothetical protein DL95DRAFT_417227 [Leptodontidium sp. 2 PMI_412]